MGTDDYFNEMARDAIESYESLAQLHRNVVLVLKQVERDTRHRCAEMASQLHGDILNSRPV
jgi:hypothetical protein